MAAQEHAVPVQNRPAPHRHRLRRGAATPVSVVVGVQEDPNGRPHETRSTGAEADDSVRHVPRYLRGVEGERELELLRLEIARHP